MSRCRQSSLIGLELEILLFQCPVWWGDDKRSDWESAENGIPQLLDLLDLPYRAALQGGQRRDDMDCLSWRVSDLPCSNFGQGQKGGRTGCGGCHCMFRGGVSA